MDTMQVEAMARELRVSGWRGVHAADRLLDGGMRAGDVCIVNCCASDRPGLHWLALQRATPASWELFDSSGSHPAVWTQLRVPAGWGSRCSFASEPLQHPTAETCSLYALLYCLERRVRSMSAILGEMLRSKTDPAVNDRAIAARVLALLAPPRPRGGVSPREGT